MTRDWWPAWRVLAARFVNAAHAPRSDRVGPAAFRLLLSASSALDTAFTFSRCIIFPAEHSPCPNNRRAEKKSVVCLLLCILGSFVAIPSMAAADFRIQAKCEKKSHVPIAFRKSLKKHEFEKYFNVSHYGATQNYIIFADFNSQQVLVITCVTFRFLR